MMTLIDFAVEDAEVSSAMLFQVSPSEACLVTVYFACDDVIEYGYDDEVTLIFTPVQAVDETGQSPVGCNSCDLGDDSLLHHDGCPVHQVNDISITTVADVTHA